MSYVGGKALNAEHILDVLNDPIFDNLDYIEPFVGYAHILRRVVNKNSYTASDVNPLLIRLLTAIQEGESIPHITQAQYTALKNCQDISLSRAVAAFTYSFNGIEWGGYIAKYKGIDRVRVPHEERRRYYARLYKNATFANATLHIHSYKALRPYGKLIYCDPPYQNTLGYGTAFDHDEFWEQMREWSRDNVVFVSEYGAPADFVAVATAQKQVVLGGGRGKTRNENLYAHGTVVKRILDRRKSLAAK